MEKELTILKKTNKRKWFEICCFIRSQAAALVQGEFRYGPGKKEQRYLDRLKRELDVYDQTGNKEHLLNICNYCILESIYPQHENHHYNDQVDSVTRMFINELKEKQK